MKKEPIRVAQVMGIMNRGGVEAVIMNYYRAIDRTHVQFDFFVDERSSFPQREEIELLGGHIYFVPSYTSPLRMVRALVRQFLQNHYTIVHAHLNTMNGFPLLAAKIANVPVRICHNHSTAHPGERAKTTLKYILRPFARLFATDYYACGENAAKWMYGKRVVNRNIVTLMANAIDFEKYAFSTVDRAILRSELGIPTDAFVIGHIGRFTFAKNHKFLLHLLHDTLRIHPNAVLLLVGNGELLNKTKKLAKILNVEANVRFVGERSDSNRYYSAMDVFCLPSFYEGLPVVLIEALANGLPCITSDCITHELNRFSVRQLPLDQDVMHWIEALNAVQRVSALPETLIQQYDIHPAAKKLEEFYMEKSEESNRILRHS